MANYSIYIPATGSTSYPTQISNFITVSEAIDTEVENARGSESNVLANINTKLNLTGGILTGTLSISSGDLTVDTGNITITTGNLNVNSGSIAVGADTVAVRDATLTNGSIVSADSSGRITTTSGIATNNIVTLSGIQTITGNKTFSGSNIISGINIFNAIPAFNGGTSGATAPFTVDSNFLVTNLNADLLDGANAATTSTASTIVKRDSSEDIYANNFNSSEVVTATDPTNVMVDLNNGFIRKQSKANFISNLNLAVLNSPTFTGTPNLPTNTAGVTQATGDNSTKLATTAYIDDIITSGTWTPTLQDISLSDSEGQGYSSQYGTYTKIGNRVLFSCRIVMSSLGSLSGTTFYIAGLPYTSSAIGSSVSSVVIVGDDLSIIAGQSLVGLIQLNATVIKLLIWDTTTGTTNLGISDISATTSLVISGSYITDA